MRETYDLEGVGDNADSHELLSVVAAVHHEGVGKTLNDGALGLAETLLGVAAGGVRHVDGSADLDVIAVWSLSSAFAFLQTIACSHRRWRISQSTLGPSIHLFPPSFPCNPVRSLAQAGAHSRQGDIPDLDILVAPLVEQLGRADLLGDILGQHRVALGRLNLDLAVGHFR